MEQHIVGIYCRLSKDDHNYEQKSMSIQNQEALLKEYVAQRGWILYDTYIDDGYTGTNFDRPSFKQLCAAARSGAINCIITKDLSRLGRNYVETGYYTDILFPELNVRYIAINDSMDTFAEDNDMMAFHHVINEIYPKQISKKVRQVKLSNAKQGKFNGGQTPYGYSQSPNNKHLLILDPDAAEVISNIFSWYAQGINVPSIIDELNSADILTPRQYYLKRKLGFIPTEDLNRQWNAVSVFKMLKNQVYLGSMVHGRCRVVSFKSKKRRQFSPEEWIVTESAHEAIISQQTWNTVQRQLERKRMPRTAPYGQAGLFSGLLECADCQARLSYMKRKYRYCEANTYRCGNYCNEGKAACTPHFIREDLLIKVVLDDLRLHARLAEEDEDKLSKRLINTMLGGQQSTQDCPERRVAEIEKRLERISSQIRSLYEDRANGVLPDEVFKRLMEGFSKEYGELETEKAGLLSESREVSDFEANIRDWTKEIKACLEIKELTRPVLLGLIDRIIVSEKTIKDGLDEQRIRIVYRFARKKLGVE